MHKCKAMGIILEKSCESYMFLLEERKAKGSVTDRVLGQFILGGGKRNLKTGVYGPKMKILKKKQGQVTEG